MDYQSVQIAQNSYSFFNHYLSSSIIIHIVRIHCFNTFFISIKAKFSDQNLMKNNYFKMININSKTYVLITSNDNFLIMIQILFPNECWGSLILGDLIFSNSLFSSVNCYLHRILRKQFVDLYYNCSKIFVLDLISSPIQLLSCCFRVAQSNRHSP